ncbi:glycoside hydrolase family 2 protein [Actinomyces ruminis]|uniref:Beta-galactosidase n=1 Tax=Actinomyces ruminis TaxID=1937003 RepID=A0ABX4MDI2_9ACTO|nr:glycoside hydrolase family 2 TIM barrel-domain containing protein [Actinomyces ruminis]PHP53525.1 hypothetical protein BW737_001975 [Actinomyces ruminis]
MTCVLLNDAWRVRTKTNIWEQLTPKEGTDRLVTLPFDALVGAERSKSNPGRIAYYPDDVEYEFLRALQAPEGWAECAVTLDIEAAYRSPRVFLNGVLIASWEAGTIGRLIPLNDYLRPGERNELKVEVRAGSDSRWYAGAGLIRDVRLHIQPLIHLDPLGPVVTTPDVDAERAVVEVCTDVVSTARRCEERLLVARILDADGSEVARSRVPATVPASGRISVRQRLELPAPRRWSVTDPYLYRVVVDQFERAEDGSPCGDPEDSASAPLGVRTIQLDSAHGLRINGESVKLRGACVHVDNGPLGTAAVGDAEERRVRLLKQAGFNALRSAHNPMSPRMLDACDRLGVLVMDEASTSGPAARTCTTTPPCSMPLGARTWTPGLCGPGATRVSCCTHWATRFPRPRRPTASCKRALWPSGFAA